MASVTYSSGIVIPSTWLNDVDYTSYGVKRYGAVGDGVTDDTNAIQDCLDNEDDIYFPPGDYLVTGTLTKTGSDWRIRGAGRLQTSIVVGAGTFDVLQLGNTGDTLNNVKVHDLTFRSSVGTRSGGAFIHGVGRLVDGLFDTLHFRNGFTSIKACAPARTYFENIWIDENNKSSATEYGFNFYNDNFTSGGSPAKTTDVHLTNCQIRGNQTYPFTACLRVNSMDGVYLVNCHLIDGTSCVLFDPDDGTYQKTCASFQAANCYFDRTPGAHVRFSGTASTAYRNFYFSNCQFRQADGADGSIVIDLTSGTLSRLNIVGCTIRDNEASGILSLNSGVSEMVVSGTQFAGNNGGAVATDGDISGVFTNSIVSGCSFHTGDAAGFGVRIISPSAGNLVSGCNFFSSTAGTKYSAVTGANNVQSACHGISGVTRGTTTITNPATSVTVTHSQYTQPNPSDITVTQTTTGTPVDAFVITNITATTFDIVVDAAPTTSIGFAWRVDSQMR